MKNKDNFMQGLDFVREMMMREETFLCSGKPKETLEDNLNNMSDEGFSFLCLINMIDFDKTDSKEDRTKILTKRIIDNFQVLDIYSDENKVLNNLVNDEDVKVVSSKLLSMGFVFKYNVNGKVKYVLPKELKEIFKENIKVNSEYAIDRVRECISFYVMLNGVLDKDFMYDLAFNYYKINIDEKHYKKAVKDLGFNLFEDQYYSFSSKDSDFDLYLKELIKEKAMFPYKYLNELELDAYKMFISDFKIQLDKILKSDNEIFNILAYHIDDANEFIEHLKENDNITKKQEEKIRLLFDDMIGNVRFWDNNGFTNKELDLQIALEDFEMEKKAKGHKLMDCLKAAGENVVAMLNNEYECNEGDLNSLEKDILANFEDYFNDDKIEVEEFMSLIDIDGEEVPSDFDDCYLEEGFAFCYKEDDKYKIIVPDEIKNYILENVEEEDSTEDIILGYMIMNGVLKKDKLKELLEVNHEILINERGIDGIIKDNHFYIIDEFYSLFDDMSLDDIKELWKAKESYKKYKVYSSDLVDIENYLRDSLEEYCDICGIGKRDGETVNNAVTYMTKNGIFSKEMFKAFIDEEGISLTTKEFNDIVDIAKELKNNISIWRVNGFSLNESRASNVKIGRNDACPCGSGKKYKKCCGK